MKENETLKYLNRLHIKIIKSSFAENVTENEIMALVNCKEAVEEIQQYQKIGTVEECRKAVEKQKAQAPHIWGDGYSGGKPVYDMYDCPNCGKSYEIDYDNYKYCPECGQRLDLQGCFKGQQAGGQEG